jgi:hypothetical protein
MVWSSTGILPVGRSITGRMPVLRMRLIAGAAIAMFAAPVRAEIEFVGILVSSHGTRFALGDTATGKTEWLGKGETFTGHVVQSFDAKTETLVLTRDGTERRLRLKDEAKVKASRLELTGSITFGATEKVAVERATLLFDQENVFTLQNGLTYRIKPERRDDGTIGYEIVVERVVADNKTERIAAPRITTLPGRPFSIHVGELGFSFTPRPL